MSLDVAVARLEEQIRALQKSVNALEERAKGLETTVASLNKTTTQGRTILLVLATLGGIFGWFVAQANGVMRLFGVK